MLKQCMWYTNEMWLLIAILCALHDYECQTYENYRFRSGNSTLFVTFSFFISVFFFSFFLFWFFFFAFSLTKLKLCSVLFSPVWRKFFHESFKYLMWKMRCLMLALVFSQLTALKFHCVSISCRWHTPTTATVFSITHQNPAFFVDRKYFV